MSAGGALAGHYAATHPDEVARRLERMPPGDAAGVVSALPPGTAAVLLPHVAPADAARILADLPPDSAAAVARSMRIDLAASLLRRMAPARGSTLLDALPEEQAHGLRALLAHGPETAGGVMDPHVLTVPAAVTAGEARRLLEAAPAHLYYYIYVIDADHRLAGVLDLAELMQADPDAPLRTLIGPGVTWLAADAPLESVFAHPGWRTLDALPVVDRDGRFLGALRHRRMRELQEQRSAPDDGDRAVRAVMALGEIYWLGLCGLLQGIAATATESSAAAGERP